MVPRKPLDDLRKPASEDSIFNVGVSSPSASGDEDDEKAKGSRSKNTIAPYEWSIRPVSHRTIGPNQPDAFLCITDYIYRLHIMDDISLAACLIAYYLSNGGYLQNPILWEKNLSHASANFGGSGRVLSTRIQSNHGAGLRTPDGKAFVHLIVPCDNNRFRDFYAVGLTRAQSKNQPNMVTWNHEAWLKKYGVEPYQKWLARLFWSTDSNNVVTRAWNDVLPRRVADNDKTGLRRDHLGSETIPPGWPLRAHRDALATVRGYEAAGGKSSWRFSCAWTEWLLTF